MRTNWQVFLDHTTNVCAHNSEVQHSNTSEICTDKQQLYLHIVLSLQLKAKANYGDLTKYSYYLVSKKLYFSRSAQFGSGLSQGCVANAGSRDNPMPRATGT